MNDIPAISYYRDGSDIVCQMDFDDDVTLNKSGFDLLVQNVILSLLSTPGKDIFEPKFGGGLRVLLGPQYFQQSFDQLRINLPQAIQAVEAQIRSIQIGQMIPSSELLKSLTLDESQGIIPLTGGGYIINVNIEAMDGETAITGIPLVGQES